MSHSREVFLIGQIFFYSGELGANQKVSGKVGMKLAMNCYKIELFLGVIIA